jgi:16S rRNA U516 pseudouridylate synthase RsuA-like enzyme
VIHPSNNLSKEYIAKTDHQITHEHLVKMSKGCFIERKWIKPKSVKKIRKSTFKMILADGKKHEVRLLAKKAGLDRSVTYNLLTSLTQKFITAPLIRVELFTCTHLQ